MIRSRPSPEEPSIPPAHRPSPSGDAAAHHRRALLAAVKPFQAPSLGRSLWHFASTFLAFVAVTMAIYAAVSVSVWVTLALVVMAAGLPVWLFIIQHHCGRGAFLRSRRINDQLGRSCGVVTSTP